MGSEEAPAVYVPSRTGKSLLLHEGYTFYLKNLQSYGRKQWYCSSRDMAGCRADVITAPARSGEGDILFLVRGRHIHAPPSYYFTPDGKYVRPIVCEWRLRSRWLEWRHWSGVKVHSPSCSIGVVLLKACDCSLTSQL
ncbi:unnamed protein product [Colias eurytheme]|nr:unnamed protein product [Colias eurytheme]